MTLKRVRTRKPTIRLRVKLALAMTVLLGAMGSRGDAQESPNGGQPGYPGPTTLKYPTGSISLVPVQGKVYLLVGAGGNITLQRGDDGVLLVDTGLPETVSKVYEAIQSASTQPIHYIINTDSSPDHVGGNAFLAPRGNTVAGGNVVGSIGESAGNQAAVIASENVLSEMSAPTGKKAEYPETAWPTETYTTGEKKLYFNDEAIEILHIANATTDGNSIVFFRSSNVISSGDIFDSNHYPRIDVEKGGSIQGELDGLNRMLEIAIPKNLQEGGTMIIPGHGRICDVADLAFYQEMVTIIRNRIQYYIDKGMTLEQVKAAKPSYDYDAEYGGTTGSWTTDRFIEAIYKGLRAAKKQ
jgi:cyclase